MKADQNTRTIPGIPDRWLPWLLVGILLLLFYPIAQTYGYTDGYYFLFAARRSSFIDVFIQGGRPLYGWATRFLMSGLSFVHELYWVRLIGVIGIGTAAAIFFVILRKTIRHPYVALACAIAFLCSPGASLAGIWSATFEIGWALAVALLGGVLLTRSFEGDKPRTKRILVGSVGLVLGLVALFTYQPAYPAFVIPIMLFLLSAGDRRKVIFLIALYLSLYPLYYLTTKGVLYLSGIPPLDRASLATNPFWKLAWFVHGPMRMVFQDNFLFYPHLLQWVVEWLSYLAAGAIIFLWARKKNRQQPILLDVGLLCGLLVCCYIPNLISVDNWASHRTLPVLFMYKWILLGVGLSWVTVRGVRGTAILGCLSIVLIGNAWYNINMGFVSIQTDELARIQSQVIREIPKMKQRGQVAVVMPDGDFLVKQGRIRSVVSDEFGCLATARDWSPPSMLPLILEEANEPLLARRLKVITLRPDQRDSLTRLPDVPVIDVEALYDENSK